MLQSLLDSLKIEPALLVANGILFLVLVQILDKLFWKKMLRHLDRRREEITGAYKTVENTRREMENLRAEYQARLATIEADARASIQETVRDAQHRRAEMIAQARTQADELLREGVVSIEREKAETITAMRESLDEMAEATLAKAVGLPANAVQKRLIDEYIAQKVLGN